MNILKRWPIMLKELHILNMEEKLINLKLF